MWKQVWTEAFCRRLQ